MCTYIHTNKHTCTCVFACTQTHMNIYNSQTVEMTQVSKYLPINLEIAKCTASVDYDISFILYLEAQRNFIII